MRIKRVPVRALKRALSSDPSIITSRLRRTKSVDLAQAWERFSPEERVRLFEALPEQYRLEVFEFLTIEFQKELIKSLNTSQLADILDDMAPDDRADMFSGLEPGLAEKLLLLMDDDEARDVRDLLEYPESTAGGRMTTDFVALSPGMTARDALSKLQESVKSEDIRNIYAVYTVDSEGRLLSGISLQRLLACDPGDRLKDVTRPVDRIKINVNQDQELVAELFAHYDLLSAPVVDDDDILIGVLTIDDMVDVMQEELNEDIAMRAGTEVVDFESGSILKSVRKRWVWLLTSFLGGLAAAVLIGFFEGALAQVTALAVFIPIIMDMGGNVGVQSSTVVVRRLAVSGGDFHWKDITSGELKAGLLMSAGFGILLWLAASWRFSPEIGRASGLGIALALAISTVLGIFLPIFFSRHRIDPAVATGPLITTAIDVVGLGVYFLLALWMVL